MCCIPLGISKEFLEKNGWNNFSASFTDPTATSASYSASKPGTTHTSGTAGSNISTLPSILNNANGTPSALPGSSLQIPAHPVLASERATKPLAQQNNIQYASYSHENNNDKPQPTAYPDRFIGFGYGDHLVADKAWDDAEKTRRQELEQKTMMDEHDGKISSKLGVYRDKELGIYSTNNVIFSTQSGWLNAASNNKAAMTYEGLKSESGLAGAFSASGRGMARLVVYGDPKTGEVSSWKLYVLRDSGEKWPNSNIGRNKWVPIASEKEALAVPGFQECFEDFIKFQKEREKVNN